MEKNKFATTGTWIYKPLNIEFYQINKFSKLDSLLILNPFLRSSFNEGNVISQTLNYIYQGSTIKILIKILISELVLKKQVV